MFVYMFLSVYDGAYLHSYVCLYMYLYAFEINLASPASRMKYRNKCIIYIIYIYSYIFLLFKYIHMYTCTYSNTRNMFFGSNTLNMLDETLRRNVPRRNARHVAIARHPRNSSCIAARHVTFKRLVEYVPGV